MAQISWWAWLLMGLGVAVISGILGEQFLLFLIVGIVLAVIGIFKGASMFMLQKKTTPTERRTLRRQSGPSPHVKTRYISCYHCGRQSHPVARFCYACGARIQ